MQGRRLVPHRDNTPRDLLRRLLPAPIIASGPLRPNTEATVCQAGLSADLKTGREREKTPPYQYRPSQSRPAIAHYLFWLR